MSGWKSRWKIVLIVVVVLIAGVIALRVLHKPQGRAGAMGGPGAHGAAAAPVPVTVVPVKQENVPVYLTANGTVQALNTVNVHPQVAGQLLQLDFTEGKEVQKGEVLAQIDARTYQASYDQAVARRSQDQAQLATARSNYERSSSAAYSQYVSKVDQVTQRNTVKQYEAAVAADNAAIRDAKLQLDYTKVIAPITGVAGIRQVDPGNILSISDSIVVLTQVHPINVVFSLPAENLDVVRSAQTKSPLPVAVLDGGDGRMLSDKGVLKVINNQIDSTTASFTLKSEFANTGNLLWPGQFVDVRMQVNTVTNGLVIPTQGVQRGPNGDYVYLLKSDNTVKMQPIKTTGEADDTHTLVGTGLKAGDKVVTEGQFRLKPGSKVTPLAPGEEPKAPTAAEVKKAAQGGGRRRH